MWSTRGLMQNNQTHLCTPDASEMEDRQWMRNAEVCKSRLLAWMRPKHVCYVGLIGRFETTFWQIQICTWWFKSPCFVVERNPIFASCTLESQMHKMRHTNGHTHLDVRQRENVREAVTEPRVCGAPRGLWYCSNTKTDGEGREEGSSLSGCAHGALSQSFFFWLLHQMEKWHPCWLHTHSYTLKCHPLGMYTRILAAGSAHVSLQETER